VAKSERAFVEAHDGVPNPQRLLAFTTLAMAISMAVLDGTIVTVALPTMARQFAVAPENAIWIVNAFQLAVTVSLLPLAALGDILGYRRVYWWGLALFTVASLACALAPTFAVLILARVVQGLGAAGIMSGACRVRKVGAPGFLAPRPSGAPSLPRLRVPARAGLFCM
jgi:DHA2 family multidrug resistance protein-like MFS transporter